MADRVDRIRELFAGTAVRLVSSDQVSVIDEPRWNREALSGRLTEISGVGAVAVLTSAIGLVLDAQIQSEPVAWITLPTTSFYPPDVADSGVDLDALAVIRVPAAYQAARTADRLARSGAFGLIVLISARGPGFPPRSRAAWSAWPSVTTRRSCA